MTTTTPTTTNMRAFKPLAEACCEAVKSFEEATHNAAKHQREATAAKEEADGHLAVVNVLREQIRLKFPGAPGVVGCRVWSHPNDYADHGNRYTPINGDIVLEEPQADSLAAAARTLIGMGWSHEGGQQWKPPFGKSPLFAKLIPTVDDIVQGIKRRIDCIEAKGEGPEAMLELSTAVNEVLPSIDLGMFLGSDHDASYIALVHPDTSEELATALENGSFHRGIDALLSAELPEDPEPEGTADDLRPLIESPARRLTLTFTHPTIGDGIFTTELLKAIGEFTIYMAKAELPSDPYDAPKEPRYPFTASNGVVVDVLAWKTVDDMGGLPSAPFMTGKEQFDHMTAAIRVAAQAMEGLHSVSEVSGKAMLQASAERISGIHAAVEAGAQDVASSPTSISVAMVRGEAEAPRAVVRDLTQETQVEPSSNRGVQGVGDSPTQVHKTYDFEQFVAYGNDNSPGPSINGMTWAFDFHGHAVTHENDSRYLIQGNAPGADMLIFNRGDILTIDGDGDGGHITIKSPRTPDALDIIEPTIGRRVWYHPDPRKSTSGITVIDPTQPLDAGVVYVWNERMVNLDVTDHAGNHHARTSVTLLQPSDEVPAQGAYAEWMSYQKGQASKGGK